VSFLLGLDVGTTNTKAVAFDPATGRVVAVASRPTPYTDLADGIQETEPAELWQAVVDCLQAIVPQLAGPILAMGVASLGEAGVPLDAAGQPVYRIIPWYDRRTEPQLQHLLERVDPLHLFQISGQATHHVYSLYKLLWLRERQPAAFAALRRWLSISDYVAWRLTGETATDDSLASRTGLFDQPSRRWSPELVQLAGLSESQLPTVLPAGTTVGKVTVEAARATGLPSGIAVGIGGHDHLCGALAVGAVAAGMVVDSIGTAESIVLPVEAFSADERLMQARMSCCAHVVPGLYVVEGGLARGGGSLEWLANLLFADAAEPVAAALAAAAQAPAGARELLYFPYLGGNGAPLGDKNLAASFVGLQPSHERRHLVRAVLEGVAFGIRHTIAATADVVGPPRPPIGVIGGGSRSALWLQIRADILGQPVQAIQVPEAVALGAALLAGVGAGVYPNAVAAAGAVERQTRLYRPDPERQADYDRRFQEDYSLLYPAIRPILAGLARRRDNG
jgi:xylulokinase